MAGDITQIVDSISATPTVLYDLNDENPCGNAVFSAPPPQLVRVGVQTQQRDGSNEASSRYGDRILDLDLDLFAASQDANAASLQRLARLLADPAGQWLKWQPVGATNPVFFRIKRADITSIVNLIAVGARTLHLTIPAEPFAYGLPESGSVTIANDPTAGTNPMSYAFPTVKGDVEAPLWLSVPEAASSTTQPVLVTTATPTAIAGPYWFDAQSGSLPAGGSGWTLTDPADSAWIGAKKRRGVKASGTTETLLMDTTAVAVPAGDYRVFVRAMSTAAAIINLYDSLGVLLSAGAIAVNSGARWFDQGVVRFPAHAPQSSDPFGLVPATTCNVQLKATMTGNGTLDLDGFLLVPVDPDGPSTSTFTRFLSANGSAIAALLRIDAVNEQYNLISAAGPPNTAIAAVTVRGSGIPVVVPGVANRLHWFRRTHNAAATSNDDITITSVISWLYFPQYLYVRPATT